MTAPALRANPIPNILTGIRLFAGVVMFAMLAGAAPGRWTPGCRPRPS